MLLGGGWAFRDEVGAGALLGPGPLAVFPEDSPEDTAGLGIHLEENVPVWGPAWSK